MAVFSSTSVVLSSSYRYRVPGAINAGDNHEYETGTTYICETPTDLSQDFTIRPVATVVVPPGAAYIVFGVSSSWYVDNKDDDHDFGINISVLKKE